MYTLNGKQIEKALFENGKEVVNTRICFDTSGLLLSNWQIDSLKHKKIFFTKHPNGKPACYIEFNDSVKNGHSFYYDTTGKKVLDYLYNNGKVNLSYSPFIDSAKEFNEMELYTRLTHMNFSNIYCKYFGPEFGVKGSIIIQMVVSRGKLNAFIIYSDIDCIQFVLEVLGEIRKMKLNKIRLGKNDFISVTQKISFKTNL